MAKHILKLIICQGSLYNLPGVEAIHYTLTQKIMNLSEETILLPGHNYAETPTSTLGKELGQNPYLKTAAKFYRTL